MAELDRKRGYPNCPGCGGSPQCFRCGQCGWCMTRVHVTETCRGVSRAQVMRELGLEPGQRFTVGPGGDFE